jgi:hypothetical protein
MYLQLQPDEKDHLGVVKIEYTDEVLGHENESNFNITLKSIDQHVEYCGLSSVKDRHASEASTGSDPAIYDTKLAIVAPISSAAALRRCTTAFVKVAYQKQDPPSSSGAEPSLLQTSMHLMHYPRHYQTKSKMVTCTEKRYLLS